VVDSLVLCYDNFTDLGKWYKIQYIYNMSKEFKYTHDILIIPFGLVLLLWLIFWIEIRFGFNFNKAGIYPLRLSGLKGIVLSPFIHSSLKHLFNNSVPLLLLSLALFYFYKSVATRVIVFGILLSGLLTWFIGRPSYHIGASGLVYVLASFLFFKGIFSKYYRLVALSLSVVFIYGSMIWGLFPVEERVSWEGHLSGFLIGFLFSLIFKTKIPFQKKYKWELKDYNEDDDEFMQQFDENGHFSPKEPEVKDEDSKEETSYTIKYHIKEKKSAK
jgi:membrane associated rhomboid family serine protease